MTAHILTPEELALLTLVQDELVPAYGDLPGAGTLGGALTVDAYLAERPWLRRPVLTALRAVEAAAGETPFAELDSGGRVGILRRVEGEDPEAFTELVKQTYNAYYTRPDVQASLGIDGPPQPLGFELPAFDESRLARVQAMGKLWRDA
ncbi:MAG: gluconate 2-dehydrogenase subunit 3 family protein [Chloroflexota bacterium]|nr:gluconate 2-dehydrogenase subunit 3 family protein [Chloroflexota bacterium]MDE2920483.1 gluconate 2-dehydrogenase subunit 3 family protein [Chloroflexota bacterium]